ncbi:MAG: hypothetical protein KUG78_20555, partial [Kangiellaceae bacterium]|nr:hypothetical protein [Kangiellaceae bacterium]
MKIEVLIVFLVLGLITSCGGSGHSSSPNEGSTPDSDIITGILIDSPLAGVEYRCSDKIGYTNEEGQYSCVEGDVVEFYIGQIKLGQSLAADILTPVDLVGTNIDSTDAKAIALMQLLQSLDYDNNPTNGIVITESVRDLAEDLIIDFTNEASVADFLSNADSIIVFLVGENASLVSPSDALAHFYQSMSEIDGDDYCLIRLDYASVFDSSASTCIQLKKRHAFVELLSPIITSQLTLQNNINIGLISDAESFREHVVDDMIRTLEQSEKIAQLYYVYQGAKKAGNLKGAAFDESVNFISGKAYDVAAEGIGEAFGSDVYGQIWGSALKIILEGSYDISQGEPHEALEKTLTYGVETAVKSTADFYYAFNLNSGVEKVNELLIAKELVRLYYKNYENESSLVLDLGLTGGFTWELAVNKVAPTLLCGNHFCNDGILSEDYETNEVIELIYSFLELVNASLIDFDLIEAPQNLEAKIGLDLLSVNLSWSKVFGADIYHLYWSSDAEENWNIIPFITSTNYTHRIEDSSATYYYKLVATSDGGESSTQSEVVIYNPSNVELEDGFTDINFSECVLQTIDQTDASTLSEIEVLSCGSSGISDVNGLESLLSLRELWIGSNNLSSIDVSANTALTILSAGNNQLSSLDVSANTALIGLYAGNNQLSSLDVSANTALTSLYAVNNQLSSLDVSANTALTILYAGNNQLSSLDVNTALTYLYAEQNQLSSLDVSANTALIDLYAWNNQLISLDVSSNTALTRLDVSSNQLSSLDVSANTALTRLDVSSNQLSSLDVSANTALTWLDVSSNQLSSLDVSANTALTYLAAGSNQLISLDVSANTALTTLYANNNQLSSLDVSANT